MSKEHKITKDGKKYITKISHYECNGCAFEKEEICTFFEVIGGSVTANKCLPYHNKDGMPRIWVEDKSEVKPKKMEKKYAWVIEIYENGEWEFWAAEKSRSQAKKEASSTKKLIAYKDGFTPKTRIRKYVPAK
jgi:hypothetical protein